MVCELRLRWILLPSQKRQDGHQWHDSEPELQTIQLSSWLFGKLNSLIQRQSRLFLKKEYDIRLETIEKKKKPWFSCVLCISNKILKCYQKRRIWWRATWKSFNGTLYGQGNQHGNELSALMAHDETALQHNSKNCNSFEAPMKFFHVRLRKSNFVKKKK